MTMRTQGLGDILNPDYVPDMTDSQEVEEFQRNQWFTFMMLIKRVTYPLARRIVRNFKVDCDAQAALYAL